MHLPTKFQTNECLQLSLKNQENLLAKAPLAGSAGHSQLALIFGFSLKQHGAQHGHSQVCGRMHLAAEIACSQSLCKGLSMLPSDCCQALRIYISLAINGRLTLLGYGKVYQRLQKHSLVLG